VVGRLSFSLPVLSLSHVSVLFEKDFRPDLPMYGQKFVHAPNLEAFANRSLVFDRAYCQIAVRVHARC
jgi:hypothetical protein